MAWYTIIKRLHESDKLSTEEVQKTCQKGLITEEERDTLLEAE